MNTFVSHKLALKLKALMMIIRREFKDTTKEWKEAMILLNSFDINTDIKTQNAQANIIENKVINYIQNAKRN